MTTVQFYQRFPTQADCVNHLENIIWKNIPICPYCQSTKQTPVPKEKRYHCNICNMSFSVTVGTIFHKTKVDLQKWFLSISLVLNGKKDLSARMLAREIGVTKDTALYMLNRIRKAIIEDSSLLEDIIEIDKITLSI